MAGYIAPIIVSALLAKGGYNKAQQDAKEQQSLEQLRAAETAQIQSQAASSQARTKALQDAVKAGVPPLMLYSPKLYGMLQSEATKAQERQAWQSALAAVPPGSPLAPYKGILSAIPPENASATLDALLKNADPLTRQIAQARLALLQQEAASSKQNSAVGAELLRQLKANPAGTTVATKPDPIKTFEDLSKLPDVGP